MHAPPLFQTRCGLYLSRHCNTSAQVPARRKPTMSVHAVPPLASPPIPVWHDEIVGLPGRPEATVRVYGACGADCGDAPLVIHFHAGEFVRGTLADGAAIA